jgi:hypothetical protein
MQGDSIPSVSPREKLLLRRFAAGRTDSEIASELRDRPGRTPEQLATVANELARHHSWNAYQHARRYGRRVQLVTQGGR